MLFKVGDWVQIISESAEGQVEKVLSNGRLMVLIDDFSYEFHESELIVVDSELNTVVNVIDEEKVKKLIPPVEKVPQKSHNIWSEKLLLSVNNKGMPEIDLHIHELVDSVKGMTNTQMLEIQIATLAQFYNGCMANHISHFIVIHGVGEGVLRMEVRKWLRAQENCEIKDAHFRVYGQGATEVQIKGLFSK